MIRSTLPFPQAAGAYAASQKLATGGGRPAVSGAGGESFADLLGRAVGSVSESGRQADAVKRAAAAGTRPEFVDMVTAIAESEAALETLVAVRDKAIQAYDDIMRMPI